MTFQCISPGPKSNPKIDDFMMKSDNPSACLYRLLKAGRTYSGDESCHAVWSSLLATDDDVVLMARLGKVIGLIADAVHELRRVFPTQENSWSYWVVTVNHAFMCLDLRATWASFNSLIDNHTINYLRFAAEALQRNKKTNVPSHEDIMRCWAGLDSISKEIVDAKLPSGMKDTSVRNVRLTITALEEYFLTGATAVLNSIKMAMGQALIDFQYREFIFKTELGRKTLNAFNQVALLMSLEASVVQAHGVVA